MNGAWHTYEIGSMSLNECNIGTWFKCFQVFISCYDEGVCPLVRCGNSSALYIVCCWYTSHYVAWLNWHSFENIEFLTYLADTSALQSTVLELQSYNLQLSAVPTSNAGSVYRHCFFTAADSSPSTNLSWGCYHCGSGDHHRHLQCSVSHL